VSAPWFHTTRLPRAGESLALDADETRHASGARRLGEGDAVVLFDGRGGLAEATISGRAAGGGLEVRAGATTSVPPARPAVHVASALPKGERQATLVAMATQLGMASFTPLATMRSVARSGRNAAERWERVALAACKQSRNPWLPAFWAETTPQAFVAGRGTDLCIVLHPGEGATGLRRALGEAGSGAANGIPEAGSGIPSTIALLIGPEGGFEDDEVAACVTAGARWARLGTGILRTETAVVAALAAVRAIVDLD